MSIEEKQKAIADIESDQEKLLAEIISISKKIEMKNIKSAINLAIKIVALGLQIRMLEGQKMVILSEPLPKYPLGSSDIAMIGDEKADEVIKLPRAKICGIAPNYFAGTE